MSCIFLLLAAEELQFINYSKNHISILCVCMCVCAWLHVCNVFVRVNKRGREWGFMKGFLVVCSGRLRPPMLMRTGVSLHSPPMVAPPCSRAAVLGENCEGHRPPPWRPLKKKLIFPRRTKQPFVITLPSFCCLNLMNSHCLLYSWNLF